MSNISFRQIWDGQATSNLSLADKFKPGGFFHEEVQAVWQHDPAVVWLREQGYPEDTQVYVSNTKYGSVTVILVFTIPEDILTYIILRWPTEKITLNPGQVTHAQMSRLQELLTRKNKDDSQ